MYKVRLPDRFMEELIYDVYSTGRVIAKDRLIGTKLKNVYLPFGGASQIYELFKKSPKVKIQN